MSSTKNATSRTGMDERKPRLEPSPSTEVDLELDQVVDPPSPASALVPKPPELRALLAAQPELLEPGLMLFQGDSRSVGAATEVGEIDLLLTDEAGVLRVVLIPESTDVAAAITEILPRMGWIARKEGKAGADVLGIVLLPRSPTTVDYAATAVADRVSFHIYRMALRFDRIELEGRP